MSGKRCQRNPSDNDQSLDCVLSDWPSRTLRRRGDRRLRIIDEQVFVVERVKVSQLSYELLCSASTLGAAERYWGRWVGGSGEVV